MAEKKFIIKEKFLEKNDFSSLENFHNLNRKFTITKRIAKHGNQSIIVIPRILESRLKPGTVAEVTINILEEESENSGGKK